MRTAKETFFQREKILSIYENVPRLRKQLGDALYRAGCGMRKRRQITLLKRSNKKRGGNSKSEGHHATKITF